jgi:GAF domain-containing protein
LRAVAEVMAATAADPAALDDLAAMAAATLKVPISLITFVDGDGQTFRGECGLPATLAVIRRMPISYSICQFTIRDPRPLLIPDTEIHPLLMGHPSVVEMGIRAYLGIPLVLTEGLTIGSLSFVDYVPRNWSAADIYNAETLAVATVEFLNGAVRAHRLV